MTEKPKKPKKLKLYVESEIDEMPETPHGDASTVGVCRVRIPEGWRMMDVAFAIGTLIDQVAYEQDLDPYDFLKLVVDRFKPAEDMPKWLQEKILEMASTIPSVQ
jgi:hypothetical protein